MSEKRGFSGLLPALAMFFLLFAYPFLGMLWHHSYPLFTFEVLLYMVFAAAVSLLLSLLVANIRTVIGNALIILSLILLVVAALWLGQANHDGLFSGLFKPNRTPGQFAVLSIEGLDRVPAAMDHETVIFVVDALEDADPGSLEALNAQGRIIYVASGTKIKVIERIRRDRISRVRVLAGTWTGRVVWVPDMALQ